MKGGKGPYKRSCNTCEFAFFVDYGYSNVTTEGTYFYCGINKHPAGPFDRFYGTDTRLFYGATCESYLKGKPVCMDVERDNLIEQKMTPAQLILWREKIADASAPPDNYEDTHGK